MRFSFKGLVFSVGVACFLAACGDDGSSSSEEKKDSPIAEVETFEELVHCTKSHFGEIALVLETDSVYECTADGWVAADSSVVEEALSGKSSSSALAKSSSSIKASAAETEKIEKKKVDSVTLSGLAQVGPFASGATVTVNGLDSAFSTTKTKFSSKTTSDSGRFEVSAITLDNQYAFVEVSGFYTNMVTGKKTSGTRAKLHAIVDLSGSKKVKGNVNLFTELEQARVKNLVLNGKFNVPAAKARATEEILALFGAKAPEGLTATDVSLADTGDVGAALYAFTVMMQADLSVSKFNSRLGNVVDDFAEDGSFDDAELRAAIADYLSEVDGKDGFASIRTNMEQVVAKVPDFESVLIDFWTSELGLGECSDSLETTVVTVKNKNSSLFHKGFACTSKRWHLSTELDTELGLCTAKMEGEFKESKLEKSPKYYACTSGEWKEISKTAYELKSCTEKRENEYVKAESGEMFVCLGKQWIELDSIAYELKACTESREGEFAKTKAGDNYVCEKKNGKYEWRAFTNQENAIGVCYATSNANVFKQYEGSWYYCDANSWAKVSAVEGECGFCTESSLNKNGEVGEDKYVCSKNNEGNYEWRKYTAEENELGLCAGLKLNTFKETDASQWYFCSDSGWVKSNVIEKDFGFCTEARKDTVIWTGEFLSGKILPDVSGSTGDFYECDGSEWIGSNKVRYAYGTSCTDGIMKKYSELLTSLYGGDLPSSAAKLNATTNQLREFVGSENEYVVCQENDWKSISAMDYAVGEICDNSLKGEIRKFSDSLFVCTDTGWIMNRCDSKNNGAFLDDFICKNLKWQKASTEELAFEKSCNAEKEGLFEWMNNVQYRCVKNGSLYAFALYTFETMTDSRDKKTYKIINVGEQLWMAENLNYNSNFLPAGKSSAADSIINSRCYERFNNITSDLIEDCSKYDRAYIWSAAMDSASNFSTDGAGCGLSSSSCYQEAFVTGICPDGWRLPTYKDFEDLVPDGITAQTDWGTYLMSVGWFGYLAESVSESYWTSRSSEDDFAYIFATSGRSEFTARPKNEIQNIRCIKK